MRVLKALVIAACLVSGARAEVADVEGADTPAFQQALEDWLSVENTDSIDRMARLAEEGNVAAELFLATVDSRWSAGLLEPRDGRQAFRRRSRAAKSGGALATAFFRMPDSGDAESWRNTVRTLVRLGERQRAIRIMPTAAAVAADRANVEFMDQFITPADFEQSSVWVYRYVEHSLRKRDPSAGKNPSDPWGEEPWPRSVQLEYRSALAEGRLSAVMAAETIARFSLSSDELTKLPATVGERLSQGVLWGHPSRPRPSRDSLIEAGGIAMQEGKRGDYLRPLYDLCSTNCAGSTAFCMQTGAMMSKGLWILAQMDSPLESLIPQSKWHASRRARVELLAHAHQQLTYGIHRVSYAIRKPAGPIPTDSCFNELLITEPGAQGH